MQKILESKEKLQDEREKVNYILSNMAEGFVMLDSQKNILLCNNSAREFFSCDKDTDSENFYNLTRNTTVISVASLAIGGNQSSVFDLKLKDGLIVNVYVSPTVIAESETGATILLVNVTAEKQLEAQNRDFFSNASHELKTPM